MAWINGYLNSDHIYINAPTPYDADSPISRPFPLSLWQCDPEIDEGKVYIPLFPDIVKLHVTPYKQRPYICVYAKNTNKVDFEGNGLAILTPTMCEVTSTINGMISVQLEHPIDKEGRWELLIINNILKVDGQLYTIKTTDIQYSGNSGSIAVYAEHIFYQLNDGWIFPVTYLYGSTGQKAIDSITRYIDYQARPGAFIYAFQGYSDIVPEIPFRREVDAGCTPVEALLGTNGFIEKLGGELYRDNFYYSINTRMENANDNAFDIRVGKNETGIQRTIDVTSMASYFRAYDAWGGWFAIAWDFEAFFGDLFPHYVVRSENFSAPENSVDNEDFDYTAYFEEQFIPEGIAFFKANCKPVISYRIDIEDVRQNPDFEIIANETLRVGDKGTVYDERLGGAFEIEISETVYDAIACKVTQITVGDRQSFVKTASPILMVDITPEPIASAVWLRDKTKRGLRDKDGLKIMRKAVL